MKILIVDDEPGIRETLSAIFKEHGFDVLVAENGKEAVQIFSENDIDFVMMDIELPEMDGLTAYQVIKKNCDKPN
ncbi:MAG: response regulator [candidate division WOR-3 bacterium]